MTTKQKRTTPHHQEERAFLSPMLESQQGKLFSAVDLSARAPTGEPAATRTEYAVLSRRYYPQQFRELVGQEPIIQLLVNALESHRVAHAYLFASNASGVGKTSTARILAKALNCVKGPTPIPCDRCEKCQAIAVGQDLDVLEIDGATNSMSDNVYDLRRLSRLRPSRDRYKVYIIDNVDMFTSRAFSMLQATLEEPLHNVKFIFTTSQVQKIPISILSHCQRLNFAVIGVAPMVERLRQLVVKERLQADDEALELIARRVAGSMRHGESLLDQLLTYASKKLTGPLVIRFLGLADEDSLVGLASAILERNPAQALQVLRESINDRGLQVWKLLDQVVDYWRDLLVAWAGADTFLSVKGQNREALVRQANQMERDTILAGMDILFTARSRLRGSNQARALLEMAVVRLSCLNELESLSQLTHLLDRQPVHFAKTAVVEARVQAEEATPATEEADKAARIAGG